jgi:hypothetical protein
MVVKVKAANDIVDETTGATDVLVNTAGDVVGVQLPPAVLRYRVDFTSVSKVKWLDPAQIIFTDGPIGSVNAVLEQAFERLVRLSYPELVTDHDQVMGRQILANRERVRMHLESGITITITSDRNTGELTFVTAGVDD